MAVALGRSRGTGESGGWTLPSLGVWLAKGRTLGLERMKSLVNGRSS
jgi:apoptosis-inducing factor 2